MEISLDTLISIATLLLGGGGGAFFTWRWQRAKAKAEAEQAETTAAKETQDMYQQLIEDMKQDRQYQREQLDELRTDRDHYKEERNELRDRLDAMEDKVRDLQHDVARNGRMVESLRPFICTDLGCKKRLRGVISANGEVEEEKKRKKEPEITPYGSHDSQE